MRVRACVIAYARADKIYVGYVTKGRVDQTLDLCSDVRGRADVGMWFHKPSFNPTFTII